MKTIIAADDYAMSLRYAVKDIEAVVKGHGDEPMVVACCDGTEALAAVREHSAALDLLVTDKDMPGETGLNVAEHARASGYEGPIILLSAYVMEHEMPRIRRLGVTYVDRLSDLDVFVQAVEKALYGG